MKYKILDIRDGWDPFWGHVVAVAANEIKKIGMFYGFSPIINHETKHFIFPDWDEIIDKIKDIAESGNFWSPSEDFTIDDRKLDNGKMIKMHFHTTLYDNVGSRTNNVSYDVTMNRECLSKISNFEDKVSEIWKKYLDETNGEIWVRSYIEELPRAELLQYLFEIDYLNDDDLITCGMRQDAFEEFVYKLEELEEDMDDVTT